MKTFIKKLPKSEVELMIEAEPSDLEAARVTALKELNQKIKVPGFRPGNIPEPVLVQTIGENFVEQETLNIAMKLLYRQVVKQEALNVVTQPEVKIESQTPFRFTAKVFVLPEIQIGDYKKIRLKKQATQVDPQEVAVLIEDIKRQNAVKKPINDRGVQKGDRVEIDFTGTTPDGVQLENTKSKNHPLVIGEGNFIPGFEEGLIGMQVGEEKTHPVKFPEGYHAKELAGQDVHFKIRLHKIEELQPPILDDAFAIKISSGQKKQWSEIEKDIEAYLKNKKENAATQKMEQELINELSKISEVEIPTKLIQNEVDFMLQDFQQRLKEGGLSWEDYLKNSKKTEEVIRTEMAGEADQRIKIRLILDKLVQIEQVEITPAEFETSVSKYKVENPEEAPEVDKIFAPDAPEGIRLKHQLKIMKLLSELIKTLSDEEK